MKHEFMLHKIYTGHFKVMEPDIGIIITGNDARFHTGYNEPCLLIGDIKFTRTKLIDILMNMSNLETKGMI